jgi:hypothetical protein
MRRRRKTLENAPVEAVAVEPFSAAQQHDSDPLFMSLHRMYIDEVVVDLR